MTQNSETGFTVNPAKTALLMLHWQNDLVSQGAKHTGDLPKIVVAAGNIESAETVLQACRKKGVLVIYVNGVHNPGYPEASPHPTPLSRSVIADGILLKGTPGAEVIDQLKPMDNDIVIDNFGPSAFYGTKLEIILHNKGITHLALAGMTTEWVVETSARDGACRGYFIYTLKDCCNSRNEDLHTWPLNNILSKLGIVTDSRTFIDAIQGS